MCQPQKHAWFCLVVIVLTLLSVGLLYPFLHKGALGGLGLLGLLGFGALFYRRGRGAVVTDERDHQIQWRSSLIAYSVFWVVFVAAAVLLPSVVYGEEGAVPVVVVQLSVWVGFMLVTAVQSIATLVQYARGG